MEKARRRFYRALTAELHDSEHPDMVEETLTYLLEVPGAIEWVVSTIMLRSVRKPASLQLQEKLELSAAAALKLYRAGISSEEELCELTDEQLCAIEDLTRGDYKEICYEMSNRGLRLKSTSCSWA